MPYDLQIGSVGLRAEVVDSVVKQVAARKYKFKQSCAIVPTSAWKNTFFRENTTVSSGPIGNVFRGVPRGATFPQSDTNLEQVSVRIIKFAVETNIPYEDIISDSVNVQARSLIRRTEEIVKAVDDEIWDGLTESRTGTGMILSFALSAGSLHRHWDETSAAIIDDVMHASQLIGQNNYETDDLICYLTPYQKRIFLKYLADKGAQFPSIATEAVRNGSIGKIANVTFVESNSVTTSYALVVKPKTCATWKELVPLTTNTTEDPLKSVRIRIAEEGVLELTDPKAVCLIKDVQAYADS